MGKQKEAATTTRSASSRAKRKEPTDQPAAQRKKQKKAEPATAAAETQPKKDQKKPRRSSSGAKKKDKKPTKQQPKQVAAAAAEQKPKRQPKKKKQEEQEQEEPEKSMHDLFMEEIHAKEAELQLHCLVLGQVETEEDETTLEDLRALTRVYVPEKVQEDFVEVWEELDAVGEDSEEEEEDGEEDDQDQPDILGAIMKAILGGKMLNTKHSAQMHAIFKTHQDKIDKALKSKDFQEAFCRWAAVLMATHREKHWYEDTDVPAAAEAVYKRMRQQWLKLKARSDQELGGLVAEGDKTPKEEFDTYLQAVADDMRSMEYEVQDVLA